MKTYRSFSSEETKNIGEAIAKKAKRTKGAMVFALKGDLGAGKTTFVQGFFKGLGVKRRAQSPTFVIMRRYGLPKAQRTRRTPSKPGFKDVFHVDAYRLKKAVDLDVLGFGELLADPNNILLIEWADRTKAIIPKNAVWLDFTHGKEENERHIKVK